MSEPDFPFICYDTEDDSKEIGAKIRAGKKGFSMFDKKVTQIAAIESNGTSFYTKSIDTFTRYLLQKANLDGISHVYALNIQYDNGNLFGHEIDALDWTLVGSRVIKAQWGPITFCDVYNLWYQGVEALGKVFGLRKLAFDSESKEYVFRDTEIIRRAMNYTWTFAASLGIDVVPPTLGSLGVKLWQAWGGETVSHTSKLARESIFGGRVEIFKTMNDSFRCWLESESMQLKTFEKIDSPCYPDITASIAYTDVTSLYPYCMTKEFPSHLEDTGTTMKRLGIASVTVEVPEAEIMVLPYRDDTGRILYGYGTFSGVWTIAELREAERRGAKIVKVHQCLSTDEGIWPYKTYMERIHLMRSASTNKVEREMLKRLMNTLFGRTGTSGEIGRTVKQTQINRHQGTPFGSKVLVTYKMPLGEEVNWSHTAHITSYGRLELLRYMDLIGAPQLIYTDTDATLFDTIDNRIPFETGSELGQMKVECRCSVCNQSWHNNTEFPEDNCPDAVKLDRFNICIPYAPKQYRLNQAYKAKGVPKHLQREYIEQGKASYELPYKFREAARFFDDGNTKRLSVWHNITKENRGAYTKKRLIGERYFPLQILEK